MREVTLPARTAAAGTPATAGTGSLLPAAGLAAVVLALYVPIFAELVGLWTRASYHYSYGVWVPLWSAWIAWTRRSETGAAASRGDRSSLLLVAAGLAVLAVSQAWASLALAVLSLPVSLTGLGLFALGRRGFRPLAYPVWFLVLMTPLPLAVFPALSMPLQHLAASFTDLVLWASSIPAARDGLYFQVGSTTLHVAEACSGLRFALAMTVIGVALAWTIERRLGARLVICAAAIALAIGANLVRVSATIALVHLYGPYVAVGTFHGLFGKAVYLAALVALLLGARAAYRRSSGTYSLRAGPM
jgi:exosortase